MSLNKVLNRPMFRKEALRKGALKPIKAFDGRMIGPTQQFEIGPTNIPRNTFSLLPEGPTSKIPIGRNPMIQYDPVAGSFISAAGRERIKRGARNLGRGIAGLIPLYGGASAAGVPDPVLTALGYGELASLPLGMMKSPTAQTTARILGAGSRFATSNPIGAIGIGGALTLGGGTKAFLDERKLVEDYAKANDIPLEKARNIFRRDLAGKEGRPITEIRLSDIGKYIIGASSARGLVAGDLSKEPGPEGKSETQIAKEMRAYFDDVKLGKGRYFQDVDKLVADAKKTQVKPEMMGPDDEINQPSINMREYNAVTALTNKLLKDNPEIDLFKATNIATALIDGEIQKDEVKDVVNNVENYSKLPNKSNDPNHPKFEKTVNTIKEVEEAVETKIKGTNVGETENLSGDAEIDKGKELYKQGITLASLDPRNTATNPQRVFLLKLAAGLLSGKTRQGGLAGFGEILGTALGPAIDAGTLVKMKNDEAYRKWATTMLDYNLKVYEARNKDIDRKLMPGAIALPNGEFVEGRRDKDTGQVFQIVGDRFIPMTPQQGQFFPQKSDAALFDNVKLIADGYLASKLLEDSIGLMKSQKGKTAIGASGLFVNIIDVVKNIPGELRDGFFGATTTFNISNTIDPLGDKEFEKLQKESQKAVQGLEKGFEQFLKKNPKASEVLAKLRVNARMLTYTLANSLKDKDRLTNRDIELINQLTQTLTAGMTDEKIIAQYEELLKEVKKKNNIRIGKLGISGYTQADTDIILNSMGLGSYSRQQLQKPTEINTLQDAYNEIFGQGV